ncbi:hypothetical protein AMEJIAPC_00677 [Caulobacter sp. NIBR1757]|nr:hypothetical protein AMEJIAPC_00677 [Caulobacter sp. NIBR1757]
MTDLIEDANADEAITPEMIKTVERMFYEWADFHGLRLGCMPDPEGFLRKFRPVLE